MRILLLLVALAFAAVLWVRHLERTRPQDLPWTPLDLRQPVGMATNLKLLRLADDPARCRRLLAQAGVIASSIRDRRDGANCGYRDAVALERSRFTHRPTPVRLTCPLAAAYTVWERAVVQPAAREVYGQEAVTIDNYGSFNCRRIAGRGAWSEHATTNAFDIAGIRLDDGRQVTVRQGWSGKLDDQRFLRQIRDGACRLFGTTLSPDYNAAHADHLHLDMKGWSACR